MTFELTEDKIHLNVRVSYIAAAVSIACCLTVLLLSLWVYSVRSARGFLDRVSFRLVLWSMFFEIIYDINYIATVVKTHKTIAKSPGCTVGIYVMIGTMGVVNYLCTAIAVNLMLTIVFGLNPIMLRLERWYVAVSIFIGMFVPIVPAALGHFGWDPLLNVCWIQADNDRARMRNFVLDLYLWQILSCVIATVAVTATLVKLFRQSRATSRALFDGNSINLELSNDSQEPAKHKPKTLLAKILHRRRKSHDRENMFNHLEDRFVSIALRISLYPIFLIVVNGIITIADLYFSATGGVKTQLAYGLYNVYYFLYGGRGIFFAFLGLFVDPCIGRGLKAVWKSKYGKHARAVRQIDIKQVLGSSELPGLQTPVCSRVDPLNISLEAGPNGTLVEKNGALRTLDGAENGENGLTTSMGLQLERQDSQASLDMLAALFDCDPGDDHDHWTHDYHGGRPNDGDADARLRKKRVTRRAASLPVLNFHVPRLFGRRKSTAVTVGGASPAPPFNDGDIPMQPRVPSQGTATPIAEMPTPPGFSMTFAGVPTGALPEIMDDHAHDVVHPAALEAAVAAAAANTSASATPRGGSGRGTTTASGVTSPGIATPALGSPPVRRGSLAESGIFAAVSGRRGSVDGYLGRRGSLAGPSPGAGPAASLRSSINHGFAPRRGMTLPVPGRTSTDSPRSPRDDRRMRRERALEIAEKLYEEMEAQL